MVKLIVSRENKDLILLLLKLDLIGEITDKPFMIKMILEEFESKYISQMSWMTTEY